MPVALPRLTVAGPLDFNRYVRLIPSNHCCKRDGPATRMPGLRLDGFAFAETKGA